MALPPHVLRIKRKRGDDPVDSLYLDSQEPNKRRETIAGADYVFRRVLESAQAAPPKQEASNGIPQVIATKPGEENDFIRRRKDLESSVNSEIDGSAQSLSSAPRVFHLRRPTARLPIVHSAKKRRRMLHPDHVAVFVEDRTHHTAQTVSVTDVSESSGTTSISDAAVSQHLAPTESPRKKPRTPATGSRPLTPTQQSSDVPNPEVYAAIQRYAAEELASAQPLQSSTPAHDQAPSANGTEQLAGDAMDISTDDQFSATQDEEADYVFDTYMRYANTLEGLPDKLKQFSMNEVHAGSIGYLIIPEAEQTIWETYYASDAGSDSDKDWDSEEDDENHENYYGADYPEDELSSGDDRDENPYRYARGSDGSDGSIAENSESEDEAWGNGEEVDRHVAWIK